MNSHDWFEGFTAGITVCTTDGKILQMNDKAAQTFTREGGKELIGRNILDCHPEKAREKVQALLQGETVNAYTIEKNGIKKLIYQAPWYRNGEPAGLVEVSLEIPWEMPHFVRT